MASYSDIFENPLILLKIVDHLDNSDAVNFSMMLKDYTFQSVVEERVDELYDIYECLKYEQYCDRFEQTMKQLIQELRAVAGIENGVFNVSLIKRLETIFDYVKSEQSLLLHDPNYKMLCASIESNLIQLVTASPEHPFHHHALFYLGELFDIHVNVIPSVDDIDDYDEYIVDRSGTIYIL